MSWRWRRAKDFSDCEMICVNVRPYLPSDLSAMMTIWNQVVEDGIAFPQEKPLDMMTASAFFAAQTVSAVAEEKGEIWGLYILHPNNEGRCGHISNASYAVRRDCRGRGVGEALVRDCLKRAKAFGFRLLQFNAVVCTNAAAIHLYRKLGFEPLGTLPGGFRDRDGNYQDTKLFYHSLL